MNTTLRFISLQSQRLQSRKQMIQAGELVWQLAESACSYGTRVRLTTALTNVFNSSSLSSGLFRTFAYIHTHTCTYALADEDVRREKLSHTTSHNANQCSHYGNQRGAFS